MRDAVTDLLLLGLLFGAVAAAEGALLWAVARSRDPETSCQPALYDYSVWSPWGPGR